MATTITQQVFNMASDDARLAMVEKQTETNSSLLTTMGETMIQLRIIAESSQKLLEIHDKGIAELHRRETEREHRNDNRHDQSVEKFHETQLRLEQQHAEDLKLIQSALALSQQCNDAVVSNTKNDEKMAIRITHLENYKWRFAGIISTIIFALSIAVPYALKVFG
jgi:ABC-type nickel/cobalt efflux system permease component RcnA